MNTWGEIKMSFKGVNRFLKKNRTGARVNNWTTSDYDFKRYCSEEREMFQSLSGLPLEQMLDRLNGYLSNHKPCLSKPASNSGRGSRNGDGDLNGDGILNVQDVVIMINLILNGGYDPSGDMNNDGVIDITDMVVLMGIILGEESDEECVDVGDISGYSCAEAVDMVGCDYYLDWTDGQIQVGELCPETCGWC